MKNYNWLLWGAAAYLVVRYLKNRNGGAAITTAPQEFQPLQPIIPYGKPGSVVNNIVPDVQAAPMPQQNRMAPQGSMPVPPSQGFKPGQL
jgi:hypothetical protein